MLVKLFRLCAASILLVAASCGFHSPDDKISALVKDPANPENHQRAPKVFQVEFTCTNGIFLVEATRAWAPNGADRFYNLAKNGYYDGAAFFRVVPSFIVQFGIHKTPHINRAWDKMTIPDDPTLQGNTRGTLSYGTRGENSRTTHLVINYRDNSAHLDPTNSVFAKVIEGMPVVDEIYAGYGDLPAFGGKGPDPGRINNEGNHFLKNEYPKLDYVISTKLIVEQL